MKLILLFTVTFGALAQSGNEKLGDLLQDRALYDAVSRLKTDDRIAMYASLSGSKPEDTHYQNQMAATYLQKMRETMDPDYLVFAHIAEAGSLTSGQSLTLAPLGTPDALLTTNYTIGA